MGSADLTEPRQQNSYAFRSGALYSSSVMLFYARRVSAKLTRGVDVLQRVPLSLSADIKLVGVTQLDVYH
jgi:hypothetical protein